MYCNTFLVMKKYHTCSHENGRQWDGDMGVVHQASLTSSSAPYIGNQLLYSTFTFHTVSLFGGYVSQVMCVTLPRLFKLMSNENRIRNNYEMQRFIKPNAPATVMHALHAQYTCTVCTVHMHISLSLQ